MEVSGYVRGVPTYADLNGKTYGMLCETKEKCITDDTGVALDFKLEELQKQTDSVGNSVTGMVNGTQKVGNADKLDGYDSSHFATAASVTNITNGTTQVGNAKTLGGNTSDAFAKKTDLANYLPLTGGKVSGDIEAQGNGVQRAFILDNGNRRCALVIRANGDISLMDSTNSKDILYSLVDGTTIFNGRATGNLPLTGGTVNGSVRIISDKTDDMQIGLSNSARNIFQEVTPSGNYYLYDNTHNTHIIRSLSDGTNTFNGKATGNGNPVHIGASAPSDTSALWVW